MLTRRRIVTTRSAIACLVLAFCLAMSPSAAAVDFAQSAGPATGRIDALTLRGNTAWAATPGGFFRSIDNGQSWTHMGDNPITTLWRRLIATDTSLLAVSWTYDVYRSTDNAQSWSQVNFGVGNVNSVQLTTRGNTFYALVRAATDALLTSTDDGVTWDQLTLPVENAGELLVNDNVLVVTGGFAEFHRSTDGGQSWTPVIPKLPQDIFARHSVGSSSMIVQAVFSDQYFRSVDDGQSWSQINPPFNAGPFNAPLGVVDGDAEMYVAYAEQNGVTLYHSDDDGQTWQNVATNGLPPHHVNSSSVLPFAADGTTVMMAFPFTSDGVYRSSDSGKTWNLSSQDIIATTLHTLGTVGGSILAAGSSTDTNYRSLDGGDTWPMMTGLPELISFVALDENTVIAGSQGSGAVRSDDGGESWTPINTGWPSFVPTSGGSLEPANDLAMHSGFVFAATGGGAEYIGDDHCGCTSAPSGDGVYRTANGGASWQRVSNGLPINRFNNFGEPMLWPIEALQSVDGALLAATSANGVYRTTNNGSNWSPTSGAPGGTDFVLFNGDVYLADGTNTLYRSTNNGLTWSVVGTDLPADFEFARLHVHDGMLYAFAGSTWGLPDPGLYQSADGNTWQSASSTLAELPISAMTSTGSELVAAVVGRGVWIKPDTVAQDINSDGAVDLFDLLDLLDAWGQCTKPCPPSCAADITGDCTVNLFDLLDLLDAWTG